MTDWHVKYDGVCARCGTPLLRGAVAVWDRSARTMRCVECPMAQAAAPDRVPVDLGIAGGSARNEFERRKAKRHAQTRDRWGKSLGGLVIDMTDEPQSTRAWAIGASGEEKLAVELAKVDGLQVLNDRR